MNEALPRWRTFGAPPAPPPTDGSRPTPAPGGRTPGALPALVAAGLGGAAAGAALTLLGLTLLAPGTFLGGDPVTATGPDLSGASAGADSVPAQVADAWSQDGGLDAVGSVIVVEVAGAVMEPGLYELSTGDRVADAIGAAGGYGARVDLQAAAGMLNLAQALADGGKVVVPELGTDVAAAAEVDDERIDLNTADQAALESLPGIGPVTAGAILAAREEQPFGTVEEMLERGVVGESVYEDIVDLVRVSG